jgi:mannose-6-phosphate isomerase-like protein (cupin superfamily)
MTYSTINFADKLKLFSDQWRPKVIAEMNDFQFKLAKLEGDFIWHTHDETDEVFICLKGPLKIEFRDGMAQLADGELFVVPKGVEHRPIADQECHVLIIEPKGVVNTGNVTNERTAPGDQWI